MWLHTDIQISLYVSVYALFVAVKHILCVIIFQFIITASAQLLQQIH